MTNFRGCRNLSAETMFWPKVDIKESDKCWNFTGGTNRGYGRFWIGSKCINVYAHRFAYESYYKCKIPKEKMVLHHCDNPLCCNPKHLYIGTHLDNMNDRTVRRRGRKTIDAKLRAGEIWLIRKLKEIKAKDIGRYNSPIEFVAAMFKVSSMTIHRIWNSDIYPCKEGLYV